MSSTKRGSDRNVSDYYVTPVEPIGDFLKAFVKKEPRALNGLVLDPCSGGDTVNDMSYPVALRIAGVQETDVTTLDLRTDSRAAQSGVDYLQWKPETKYNLIISNPPFVLAQQFIEKAQQEVVEGGFVVMLLRLNFFGSLKRQPFWANHMAKYAFVHARRISFIGAVTERGKKASDSIEYMHCCWQSGYKPDHTELLLI